MSTMTWVVVGLLAELVLLALLLLGWAWIGSRRRSARDAQAHQTLMTRLKQAKVEREAALNAFLGKRMHLSGEALDASRVAILRGELGLLKHLGSVYLRRDAAAAARMDLDLFAALEPYHQLSAEVSVKANTDDSAVMHELEALRADNRRLSDELRVSMETMTRMLSEYSTVFASSAERTGSEDAQGQAAEIADDVPDAQMPSAMGDDGDLVDQRGEDLFDLASDPTSQPALGDDGPADGMGRDADLTDAPDTAGLAQPFEEISVEIVAVDGTDQGVPGAQRDAEDSSEAVAAEDIDDLFDAIEQELERGEAGSAGQR